MEKLLELLQQDGQAGPETIAAQLGRPVEDVRAMIQECEASGIILGYHAVIDREKIGNAGVSALIEVRLTPERGGGFDRLAHRIARFEQVSSCYLMSGAYDLAVIVEGNDLREVARFVSEKLSTIEGVISTATHFQLKIYKQNGFLSKAEDEVRRLPVAP